MHIITAKFGNMKKAVEWTVYPRPTNVDETYNVITIQSDHRICKFHRNTGLGVLSPHAANYPKFDTGSIAVTVPQDVIATILTSQPRKGDSIGGGVYIG